jgi:hypothetical protein
LVTRYAVLQLGIPFVHYTFQKRELKHQIHLEKADNKIAHPSAKSGTSGGGSGVLLGGKDDKDHGEAERRGTAAVSLTGVYSGGAGSHGMPNNIDVDDSHRYEISEIEKMFLLVWSSRCNYMCMTGSEWFGFI